MKVLILGGGASGLMAALSAAQDERNTVTVLERQSRVGRKLLATGNGRCQPDEPRLVPGALSRTGRGLCPRRAFAL